MRPTLHHEAGSAFGPSALTAVSVMITRPAGEPWYVVFDRTAADPLLHESDREDEAREMAKWFAALGDLGQVAQSLLSSNKEIFLAARQSVGISSDGLKLLDAEMVKGSCIAQLDGHDDLANNENWQLWLQAMASVPELSSRPASLIYCFSQETLIKEEEGSRVDSEDVYVLLEIDWGVMNPRSISIHVLDEDYVLNGEPLYKTLYAINRSPEHEIFYETPDELEWELPTLRSMPLFSQLHTPEQSHRIIAYEGGQVLEALCKTHPWLLQKNADGQPVPLRVEQVPEYLDCDEKALQADHHMLSSIFLTTLLEQHMRAKAIELQRAQGVAKGQAVDGQAFSQVFDDGHGVVLEAAYDKTTPNVIGTRDWLSYRVWVEGELVMDVRPGNKELYDARSVSISPLEGPVSREAPLALSDSQVGGLLATALSPLDDDEGARDAFLPERVKAFLASSRCDELSGDANALESGDATLVNGKLVHVHEHDDQHAAATLG